MVKGKEKIKKYIIQDKKIEEIVEVKYNYLSVLVIYYLQITLLIKRAYKNILQSHLGD